MQRLKATPAKILGPLANNQRFCQRVHPFAPRLPWVGGDLQTLRATLSPQAEQAEIVSSKQIRLQVPLSEACLPLPVRRGFSPHLNLTLDYPPEGAALRAGDAKAGVVSVMLLIHGMGGDEDSDYMRRTAQYFLRRGWVTARLNMRGTLCTAAGGSASAGGVQAHLANQSRDMGAYHAGLFEDINPVLDRLAKHFAGQALEFYAVGFSLGGHLLLRYLSEESGRGRLKAGVSVSAPLDLAACQQRLEEPRNRIYNKYLTQVLKEQFAPLIQRMRVREADLKSVRDIDDRIVGPLFGFGDSEGYYASQSVWPHLSNLHTPTLMLHAEDDPWIPAGEYLRINWPQQGHVANTLLAEADTAAPLGHNSTSEHVLHNGLMPSGAVVNGARPRTGLVARQSIPKPAVAAYTGAVLAPSGGHVGFHSALTQVPWYVQAANLFLREISTL